MDTYELIQQLLGYLNEAVKSNSRGNKDIAEEHLRRLQHCHNHYRPLPERVQCESAESSDPGKQPKMSPQKAALHIQRYATEAIEGLRTQGATADTEHRLTDIRSLACGIANDLQPIHDEPVEAAES